MKELVGKTCHLIAQIGDELLVYTAPIKVVSDNHIGFYDQYGDYYRYRIDQIIEIKEKKGFKEP